MSEAVDLMLGVFRAPARSAVLRTRELPDGVLDVIRIAAGDAEAIAAAKASTPLAEADLHVAASLLLHNLCLFDGADSYRTLGVRADADSSRIKQHFRWLVRWLHPDRNPDNLHGAFTDRVNRAWNSVRTPERRARYDLERQQGQVVGTASVKAVDTSVLLREWAERSPAPLLSGHAVRRLPQLIAIAAGAIAIGALGLAAWLASLDADPLPHEAPVYSGRIAMAEVAPPAPLRATSNAEAAAPSATARPVPLAMPVLPATPDTPVETGKKTPATIAAAVAPSPPAVLPPSPATAAAAAPQTLLPQRAAAKSTATASPGAAAAIPPPPARAAPPRPAIVLLPQADPASAAPPRHAAAVAPASAISPSELHTFVERFQRLYSGDDIDGFLALFSAQAQGNNGSPADLIRDYRRLFAQRPLRRLQLSQLHWDIDGSRAAGNGNYEAWVGPGAGRPESRTHGLILLQLVRGDDGMRITRLHHAVAE